jgi:hypothetical protein
LRALQLAQQMLQAGILQLQVIALCQGGVPLRARLCQERVQRLAAEVRCRSRAAQNQIRAPL